MQSAMAEAQNGKDGTAPLRLAVGISVTSLLSNSWSVAGRSQGQQRRRVGLATDLSALPSRAPSMALHDGPIMSAIFLRQTKRKTGIKAQQRNSPEAVFK